MEGEPDNKAKRRTNTGLLKNKTTNTEGLTQRQTDRQTDRQKNRQTDIQTDRQTGRQTHRQIERQIGRQTDKNQTDRKKEEVEYKKDKPLNNYGKKCNCTLVFTVPKSSL